MISLDSQDMRILEILQEDGAKPTAEIAEMVGLSLSPCWRRIRRLRDAGVIAKDVALLDRHAIGLEIDAVTRVTLSAQQASERDSFESWAVKCSEIVECLSLSGDTDYILRILVPDLAAYEHFLTSELLNQGCVSSVSSSFVLREVKKTTALPLPATAGPS
ncbi:MAG: Lrp/AsnC family transcriptional regulator [Alphaproteobacteria bacterium]|nr:MAG: Lrp/AsnC family transcriptional regulator [Alphaproteobacteria bacterium]